MDRTVCFARWMGDVHTGMRGVLCASNWTVRMTEASTVQLLAGERCFHNSMSTSCCTRPTILSSVPDALLKACSQVSTSREWWLLRCMLDRLSNLQGVSQLKLDKLFRSWTSACVVKTHLQGFSQEGLREEALSQDHSSLMGSSGLSFILTWEEMNLLPVVCLRSI